MGNKMTDSEKIKALETKISSLAKSYEELLRAQDDIRQAVCSHHTALRKITDAMSCFLGLVSSRPSTQQKEINLQM